MYIRERGAPASTTAAEATALSALQAGAGLRGWIETVALAAAVALVLWAGAVRADPVPGAGRVGGGIFGANGGATPAIPGWNPKAQSTNSTTAPTGPGLGTIGIEAPEFPQVPGKPKVPASANAWRRSAIAMAGSSGFQATALCGCVFDPNLFSATFTGIDPRTCGYLPRRPVPESRRVAPLRVVPDVVLSHGRPCMDQPASTYVDADGHRIEPAQWCATHDPLVMAERNDLFNTMVEVEEIVVDTVGMHPGIAPQAPTPYGTCPVRLDHRANTFEPPDAAKGRIARIWLYMSEIWGIYVAPAELETYKKWHQAHPPTREELTWGKAVALDQGMENPYLPIPDSERWGLPPRIDKRFLDPNAK